MNLFLPLVALAFAAPVMAADIGVSISIGDPNFFGHIDIVSAPPPVVIYREPIVVVRQQVVLEPIYLRVRAGQAQNWPQYCGQYNACNRPVYFVQDSWYSDVYAPHYRERHGKGHGKDNGKKHGKSKGHKG